MVKATVSVFLSETHVDIFEPKESMYIIDHPDNISYDRLTAASRRAIESVGFVIQNEYTELNEFGDPITCYFVTKG